jgi:hypothetical protein
MKDFLDLSFNPAQCQGELNQLGELLTSKKNLSEKKDLQPFFKARLQLTAFIGSFVPDIGLANHLAFEFPVHGDFVADIVVGNKERHAYCLIELEDASHDSVFTAVKGKATREWSRRLEHGFGQLVDWFHALDDQKNTQRFAKDFGYGHIRLSGMIILGRSDALTEDERNRPKWRSDKILVNSNSIRCFTFDDLYRDLSWRLGYYPVEPKPGSP